MGSAVADPAKPVINYSYADFQEEQQDTPFPGTQLDNDLANIVDSLDATIDGLKDVRRADGKLKNGVVTADSFDQTSFDMLIANITQPAQTAAAAAAVSATNAAGSATMAANSSASSAGWALTSQNSAASAQSLVTQATAGFAGFQPNLGYDFGSVTDALTFFNQDWGSV